MKTKEKWFGASMGGYWLCRFCGLSFGPELWKEVSVRCQSGDLIPGKKCPGCGMVTSCIDSPNLNGSTHDQKVS